MPAIGLCTRADSFALRGCMCCLQNAARLVAGRACSALRKGKVCVEVC